MAYVTAVCGSGGKTTLVKSLAKKYANENKKVCVTTTTHMWYDEDVKESLIVGTNVNVAGVNTIRKCTDELCEPSRMGELCEPKYIASDEFLSKNKIKSGRVYYIVNVNREKELITPLNESDYKTICEIFDYVIIEADGSRSMPMKIPKMKPVENNIGSTCKGERYCRGELCEPAIPFNTNEIIIVVGKEAIGREISAVCHRFKEFYGNDKYLSDKKIKPETIVTDELLDDFVKHYYYEPLKQKFCMAKISIYKNDFAVGSHSSPIRTIGASYTSAKQGSHSAPIRTVGASYTSAKQGLHCAPMRIAIVLCASGFSKRFGENKLLVDVSDKETINVNAVGTDTISQCRGELCEPKRVSRKLYQLMIGKLLSAKEILTNKLNELDETKNENKQIIQNKNLVNENDLSNEKNFDVDIVVVSQYDEILNDNNYKDKVFMLKNDNASEGLSASIKLGVEFCKGSDSSPVRTVGASYTSAKQGSARAHSYDAVVLVNADLPHLPDKELANFIFNSILNKNGIAVMYSDDYKNPAYFEKKYFGDLMTLSGDKGARELFDKYKMNVYKYYINDKYLLDIDTKEDLEKQICKVTL